MDEKNRLKGTRKEGIKKGKFWVVMKAVQMGMDVEIIGKLTELSVGKVNEIRKNIKG
ncbi:MAG: hypothetical protein PHX70_14325 [Clostridium sp.]|nr:hypothetical protein [Clostridium sp.]